MIRVARCIPFLLLSMSPAHAQSIDAFDASPGGYPTSLALQADGKVVIVGNFLDVGGTPRSRIARLNVDGSLDPSFGDAGVDSEIKTVAVLADGKLLIGGGFTQVGGQPRHSLARLNDDGTLDTAFADPGIDAAVWAIAVQPDGRVIAGGSFQHVGATARSYFARLEANGALDTTFADPQFCCNIVLSVGLQPDGHVLVGGAFSHVGADSHFALARFSTGGAFDAGFPNVPDSIVLLANDMNVAPDGSVFLAGAGAPSMRKLHADGTLDTTFNGADCDGSVYSVALQPNGKLVVAGTFHTIGGQPRHGVARLNANGSLDASFGDLAFGLDATHPDASVFNLAAQADGNVIASGNFSLAGGHARTYMARIDPGNYATSVLVVGAAAGSITATWIRSGDGPELAQPPMLMHSTDGVHFSAVGPMARIANGWRATASYDVHGARFYLQVIGTTSGGAQNGSPGQVDSEVYSSDTIFRWGFE